MGETIARAEWLEQYSLEEIFKHMIEAENRYWESAARTLLNIRPGQTKQEMLDSVLAQPRRLED